jgi:hypothetical protein
MDDREIALESLLLDTSNPRHDPVDSQDEAIHAFLRDRLAQQQLLRLAKDIAEYGLSPIELTLVVPENGLFVVVEGNRRVLAMKLLKNPGLAEGFKIKKAIQEVSRTSVPLDTVRCVIAPSHDEARRWIQLRHTGSDQGRGVIGWSPLMQVRFDQVFTGHRGKAYRLTKALKEAYEDDAELLSLIQVVRTTKLTTLGRLVSDPHFRETAGIEIKGDEVTTNFSPEAMRDFWYRLFTNFSTDLTVSDIKSKDQRANYLESLADVVPPAEARQPRSPLTAQPPTPTTGTIPAKRTQRRQPPRRARLFQDLVLHNVELRARDVLREAQRIDLAQFPNAGAVLIRVLVDLVVYEAQEHYQFSERNLRDRVRVCLHKLDPSGKANRYAPIRKALSDNDSPLSVTSMHAYLHNTFMQPDPVGLRAISENYLPLLADLDNAIGSGQRT